MFQYLFYLGYQLTTNISDEGITKKEDKPGIHITYFDKNSVRQGHYLNFNWIYKGKVIDYIDIYAKSEDGIWKIADKKENWGGDELWLAGAKFGKGSAYVPSGKYEMIVCPARKNIKSNYCDSFEFTLFGEFPIIEILSPKRNEIFKAGDTIELTFDSVSDGERYSISLLEFSTSNKVLSVSTVLSEEFYTESIDINYHRIELPDTLKDGKYMLTLGQLTVHGIECDLHISYHQCVTDTLIIIIEN